MKLRDKILNHPAAEFLDYEGSDGYWCYLKAGWTWDGCTCVHEWTLADVWRALRTEVVEL